MTVLHDDVLDNGLQVLTDDATTLHFCSAEPTSFAEAGSLSLGNKAGPTVGAPGARSPSGRKVTVSAIGDGLATGDGTVSHWALTDNVGSRLLAAAALDTPMAVLTDDTITSPAFDIGIPGPA